VILYPAIDLKDGACVRLLRGALDQATLYERDPTVAARRFAGLGFDWLHVVDLDGAVAGAAVNAAAVQAILAAVPLRVQLGGGIRDMAAIEHWLAAGVSRVILGTAAVRDPALVVAACRAFPGRICVGIDARGGRVATAGWTEASTLAADTLARRYADSGVAALIHTDIERDGALGGVNVAATAALARCVPVPVVASGGVASLADVAAVRAAEADGVAGLIIGRAFYDGALDPAAALALAQGGGEPARARHA